MIKIIYVDDEEGLLSIAKLFLEKDPDLRVDIANSPKEAIEMISQVKYDIIISDYEMPIMNGIQLLKHINKMEEKIPFIIFTGRGREDVVIEALNNGANFYIQKGGDPIAQFVELSGKIKTAVNEKRLVSKHKSIYNLTMKMVMEETLQESLDLIAESIPQILGADASFILLLNKEKNILEYRASYGISEQFKGLTLKPGEGMGWKVMTEHIGYMVDNYFIEGGFNHTVDRMVQEEHIISAVAAPLQMKNKSFGVLYAVNKTEKQFTKEDLETLSLFGNLAAIAAIKDQNKQRLHRTKEEMSNDIFIMLGYIEFLRSCPKKGKQEVAYLERVESVIKNMEKEITELIENQ